MKWEVCLEEEGGGIQPDFIEKLDFEIEVDQESRTKDITFGGVADPKCPSAPALERAIQCC